MLSISSIQEGKFKLDYEETKLKSLKSLNATNMDIEVLDSTVFDLCPNLEELNVSNNSISQVIAPTRSNKLRCLDISYNKLQNVNFLNAFPNLEKLSLKGNPLTFSDRFIAACRCPKLKTLDEANILLVDDMSKHYDVELWPKIVGIWTTEFASRYKSYMNDLDFVKLRLEFEERLRKEDLYGEPGLIEFRNFKVETMVTELMITVKRGDDIPPLPKVKSFLRVWEEDEKKAKFPPMGTNETFTASQSYKVINLDVESDSSTDIECDEDEKSKGSSTNELQNTLSSILKRISANKSKASVSRSQLQSTKSKLEDAAEKLKHSSRQGTPRKLLDSAKEKNCSRQSTPRKTSMTKEIGAGTQLHEKLIQEALKSPGKLTVSLKKLSDVAKWVQTSPLDQGDKESSQKSSSDEIAKKRQRESGSFSSEESEIKPRKCLRSLNEPNKQANVSDEDRGGDEGDSEMWDTSRKLSLRTSTRTASPKKTGPLLRRSGRFDKLPVCDDLSLSSQDDSKEDNVDNEEVPFDKHQTRNNRSGLSDVEKLSPNEKRMTLNINDDDDDTGERRSMNVKRERPNKQSLKTVLRKKPRSSLKTKEVSNGSDSTELYVDDGSDEWEISSESSSLDSGHQRTQRFTKNLRQRPSSRISYTEKTSDQVSDSSFSSSEERCDSRSERLKRNFMSKKIVSKNKPAVEESDDDIQHNTADITKVDSEINLSSSNNESYSIPPPVKHVKTEGSAKTSPRNDDESSQGVRTAKTESLEVQKKRRSSDAEEIHENKPVITRSAANLLGVRTTRSSSGNVEKTANRPKSKSPSLKLSLKKTRNENDEENWSSSLSFSSPEKMDQRKSKLKPENEKSVHDSKCTDISRSTERVKTRKSVDAYVSEQYVPKSVMKSPLKTRSLTDNKSVTFDVEENEPPLSQESDIWVSLDRVIETENELQNPRESSISPSKVSPAKPRLRTPVKSVSPGMTHSKSVSSGMTRSKSVSPGRPVLQSLSRSSPKTPFTLKNSSPRYSPLRFMRSSPQKTMAITEEDVISSVESVNASAEMQDSTNSASKRGLRSRSNRTQDETKEDETQPRRSLRADTARRILQMPDEDKGLKLRRKISGTPELTTGRTRKTAPAASVETSNDSPRKSAALTRSSRQKLKSSSPLNISFHDEDSSEENEIASSGKRNSNESGGSPPSSPGSPKSLKLPLVNDWNPSYFLRCHSRNSDMNDAKTNVWQCAFEPDPDVPGKSRVTFATCGGQSACIIDANSGKVMKRYKHTNPKEELFAIAWSIMTFENSENRSQKKMSVLAVAGRLREIRLLHPQQLVSFAMVKGHSNYINSLVFHPNEPNYMCSGSSDGTAIMWRISNPKLPTYDVVISQLYTIEIGCALLNISYVPTKELVLCSSDDGCYGWKLTTKKEGKKPKKPQYEFIHPPHSSESTTVDSLCVLTPDLIASKCASRGSIYIWNLQSTIKKRSSRRNEDGFEEMEIQLCAVLKWSLNDNYYMNLGFSQNAGVLACGDNVGQIWLYDLKNILKSKNKPSKNPPLYSPSRIVSWPECKLDSETQVSYSEVIINKIAFSSDGRHMASVTDLNLVCIWEEDA